MSDPTRDPFYCVVCGRKLPAEAAFCAAHEPSRYELLIDDPGFGLAAGDVLICERMHWAWGPEKVAVVRRESDGYEPGCSQYREHVRHLSGPRL